MESYKIVSLKCDGYERFATIEKDNQLLNVHFLEFEEYLEYGDNSVLKKEGTIIFGELSVGLVSICKKTHEKLYHRQLIQNSPTIDAVVQVIEVLDECTVVTSTSFSKKPVIVSFEDEKTLEEQDVIYIEGSLEFEE